MKMRRMALAAVGFAAILTAGALAAGNYSTYPVVGGSAFCAAIVGSGPSQGGITGQGAGSVGPNGTYCAQTVPAGPPELTGADLIPADTILQNGAPPASVVIPSALIGSINAKINRLVGGDFGTNLWQRGTTPVSAASPTAAVMSADRFYAYSASTQVTVSKQTGASDTIPTLGFYASMRVARPSAQTGTGAICVGQVLDKQATAPLLGNNGILSFYALAGANFSPTNSNVVATVAYFTAGDAASAQSAVGAAGTNTLSFATGTTTGYTAVVGGVSNGTTGTAASGAATIPISTAWTRYSVYAPIPATNASGTAITGVGISICYTPTGTAGTNDWMELDGIQLQVMPSTVTNALPAGVTAPTGFERRSAEVEAALQLYYSQVVSEVASSSTHAHAVGGSTTTGNANTYLQFSVPMRQAPAMAYTAGFASTGPAGAAETCSALATLSNSISPSGVTVSCTSTGNFTANQPSLLIDNTGAGIISASSEP